MGSRAGLQSYEAEMQSGEERQDLRAPCLSAHDGSALGINGLNREHVLGQIQTNGDDFLHG